MTYRRHLVLYVLLAAAFLLLLWVVYPMILPGGFDHTMVFGQGIVTVQPGQDPTDPSLVNASMNFTYPNGTVALLNEFVDIPKSNAIVKVVNSILLSDNPDELEELIPPEDLEALQEEQQLAEIEEEDSDSTSGSGSSSTTSSSGNSANDDDDDGEISDSRAFDDAGSSGAFDNDNEDSSNDDSGDSGGGDPSWQE